LLQSDNVQVIGLDNFDDFYSREQKEKNMSAFISNSNFSFIEGDIRNMNDLLALSEIDVIVHLAAKAGVRTSIKNPILFQDVNVSGTQNLLELARQRNINSLYLHHLVVFMGLIKMCPGMKKKN
jgi:UDP-glucuronate 4-epimerase